MVFQNWKILYKYITMNRRTFLKTGSLTTAGTLMASQLAMATNTNLKPLSNKENLTILFQGDSITDAGRGRGNYYPNDASGMGNGYVYQIASRLLGENPTLNIKNYNRGISGHKVPQLDARWEDDCLQLQPDIMSLLIGVNDFWHTLDWGYKGTAESFDTGLRKLMDRTLKAMPNLKLIIAEPFAVKGGSAINERWKAFEAYQTSVRKISEEYNTAFIPCQDIFDKALDIAPASYWCPDGVHPSMAGGYLMAEAWLGILNRWLK
jgi:lysophospholipase L1-like esterase